MEISYDLHIHTALSPCAVADMTPNNIVNMALLSELDVIAITDHNSCENLAAVLEVAKDTDLIVIPGIEIETREEIHVICLFPSLDFAYNVQKIVYETLPPLKNRTKIFGEQILYDSQDEPVGAVERLLSFATSLSFDEVFALCESNQGICIPAHIDRPSYSVISNLGMIPEHMSIKTIEVSRFANIEDFCSIYDNYNVIQSSDSHELGFIGSCNATMEVNEKSIEAIIKTLSKSKSV